MVYNLISAIEYNQQRVAAGQQQITTLVPTSDVSNAREATLLVRVHAASFAGTTTNPTLAFNLGMMVPSTDGKNFGLTTSVVSASFGAQVLPVAGQLIAASNISGANATPLGGWVRLVMDYTQYTATCTSALFTISVDLVLKR